MQYAPIALFTYNRPDHTKQAVESLLKNEEAKYSDLFIFSDGPKNEMAVEGVKANREYLRSLKAAIANQNEDENHLFKSITIVEREKNWGLANSLIAGITEIVNRYGRVIVVEDDLVLSPYFLKFMNDALEKYKDEEKVASISAFLNPVGGNVPNTFFLRYFACWGWATWKRAWNLLNPDANDLLKQIRWKTRHFNFDQKANFYGQLYCQKLGLIDSWAIRFYASLYLNGKLILYPGETMTKQAGRDGSGTHSKDEPVLYSNMVCAQAPIEVGDIEVVENTEMYRAFRDFYKKEFNENSIKRNYNVFKSFIRRLIGMDYD